MYFPEWLILIDFDSLHLDFKCTFGYNVLYTEENVFHSLCTHSEALFPQVVSLLVWMRNNFHQAKEPELTQGYFGPVAFMNFIYLSLILKILTTAINICK